jgi:MYXO-CTERM domain-containing protein
MRKTIATICATGALIFGSAGVANAAIVESPVPASTTTTLAQTDDTTVHDSDKTGLWGLAGLLGLLGLAGLKRRNDQPVTDAGRGYGNTPRA